MAELLVSCIGWLPGCDYLHDKIGHTPLTATLHVLYRHGSYHLPWPAASEFDFLSRAWTFATRSIIPVSDPGYKNRWIRIHPESSPTKAKMVNLEDYKQVSSKILNRFIEQVGEACVSLTP